MGLATIGDAVNVTTVRALLVRQANTYIEKMHVKEKLAKIGVHVERETVAQRVERATFETVDCVVLIEGAATAGERDILLRYGTETNRAVFVLNEKRSHVSWERLADFAKRKGMAKVVSIHEGKKPVEEDEAVRDKRERDQWKRDQLGSAPGEDDLSKKIVYTRGPIPSPPERASSGSHEVFAAYKEAFKEAQEGAAKNQEAIDALRADVVRLAEESKLYEEEIAKLQAEVVGVNRASDGLVEEVAKLTRERDGLRDELATAEKVWNERYNVAVARINAQNEEILKLRQTEGKRAGGHAGQAERWKREYKAKADAAEEHVAKLTAEIKALRAQKPATLDEAQVMALLTALSLRAISAADVTRAIVKLAKGGEP